MVKQCLPLIVIPVYNEAATIASVVRKVYQHGWHDILVVNDCCSDLTEKRARESGADVITHSINLGAWGAIQTGMRYAMLKGYFSVVTLDGDNQHDPAHIQCLLDMLNYPEMNDLVIGSCIERGSAAKCLVWYFFRKFSGLSIRDITSGFRAYNRKTMELLLTQESLLLEFQDVGVLLLCKKNGIKMVEVYVEMNRRKDGRSRIFKNISVILRYIISTFFLIGLTRW